MNKLSLIISMMFLTTGLVGCGAAVDGEGSMVEGGNQVTDSSGTPTALDPYIQNAVDKAVGGIAEKSINDLVEEILDRVAQGIIDGQDSTPTDTDEEEVVAETPETDEEEVVAETPDTPDTEEEVVAEETDDSVEREEVRLSWTPASKYEDGTNMPESEIDSFVVRYGASKDAMDNLVHINKTALNSKNLKLPQGKWFIKIKTRSVYDITSRYSNIIEVSI